MQFSCQMFCGQLIFTIIKWVSGNSLNFPFWVEHSRIYQKITPWLSTQKATRTPSVITYRPSTNKFQALNFKFRTSRDSLTVVVIQGHHMRWRRQQKKLREKKCSSLQREGTDIFNRIKANTWTVTVNKYYGTTPMTLWDVTFRSYTKRSAMKSFAQNGQRDEGVRGGLEPPQWCPAEWTPGSTQWAWECKEVGRPVEIEVGLLKYLAERKQQGPRATHEGQQKD